MSVAILADKFVSIDGIDRDDAIFGHQRRPSLPTNDPVNLKPRPMHLLVADYPLQESSGRNDRPNQFCPVKPGVS